MRAKLISLLLWAAQRMAWISDNPVEPGLSYHDLYVTTANMKRTRLFNMPLNATVICTRTGGWELWNGLGSDAKQIAGEYAGKDKWLRLDVCGRVIAQSTAADVED